MFGCVIPKNPKTKTGMCDVRCRVFDFNANASCKNEMVTWAIVRQDELPHIYQPVCSESRVGSPHMPRKYKRGIRMCRTRIRACHTLTYAERVIRQSAHATEIQTRNRNAAHSHPRMPCTHIRGACDREARTCHRNTNAASLSPFRSPPAGHFIP